MADRYWVGGTANWDNTAGTKWSTTSGGTGGASRPTTADDVFFTNLSTGTCTILTNSGAKSINCTGFAGTITGTTAITVAGSITLSAGMTYTHTGTVTITGTSTLTTAGKAFSTLTINLSGITVTLGDALDISTRTLTLTNGTFNTANFSVTAGGITVSSLNTKIINLGSSTVTLANNGAINFPASGFTFNAGTSQINITNTNPTLAGGGKTFYNVSYTSTLIGTRAISGANTFNNLTLTVNANGLIQLNISADQTINGTFTCAGSSAIARGFVRSDIIGTTRTITANAISANDCDFRDITLAGTASGSSPTRAGNCGGNSGITFPTAKTVYWNLGGIVNWNANGWATTSTGTPDVNNFPLAQDTATFTNAGSAGTIAYGTTYNTGTIDASGRTSAMSLAFNSAGNIYGNFTLGSGVTISANLTQTFIGRGTQTFTSAGSTITFQLVVDKIAGAFELGDATTTSNSIAVTRGTFDAKNYNLTCNTFSSTNTNVRTITMGSGLWTLSGDFAWNLQTTTNLTFNKNTANILLSSVSSASKYFYGGGLNYNKLTNGGATGNSFLFISGINTFTELASIKTVAHTIYFESDQTIGTWSVTGTVGNVVDILNNSAEPRATINLTNITTSAIDYLSVTDIAITDANKFYVGVNSTDGGNNLNVYFTASPVGGTNSNFFFLF
jgi:hypothetical protein